MTITFYNLYDDPVVSYILNMINNAYNEKNFKKLNKIIYEMVITNMFIKNETKEQIFESYRVNLKLKYLINKCINNFKYKKIKSVNSNLISLEPIDSIDYNDKIELLDNNTKYTFHYKELIKTIKNNLEQIEDIFPQPQIPVNPYTNQDFTIYQLVYIFNKLNNLTKTKNEKLDIIFSLFEYSKFNIHKFKDIFGDFLINRSAETFVKELDENEWFDMLEEFFEESNFKNICIKCIKEIPDYRIIFSKVLVYYQLEINYLTFINRKSKSMMLFRKLKNFYKLKSCFKHRKYFVRKKNIGFDFSEAVANMNNNTPHDFNFSHK
jgi:hypothetical protein